MSILQVPRINEIFTTWEKQFGNEYVPFYLAQKKPNVDKSESLGENRKNPSTTSPLLSEVTVSYPCCT